MPGGIRVAAGQRQRQVRARDAVEEPQVGLPEERALGVVGADRGRRRFVDLDQRTARGGQLAQERVEGGRPGRASRWPRAPACGPIAALPCTGPATACLTA